WKRMIFAQFHDYIPGSSVWDVYLEGLPELDAHAKTQVKEGTHRAGFSVTRKVGASSSATVFFILEAGSPLVEVRVELDWQEPEHLLKLIFPSKYAAENARFGTPFSSVLHPQQANGLRAEAMWEVPFSRYLTVFDEGESEGIFLTTQSKYGATVRDGSIGLSLLRSPRVTGCDGGRAWPADIGESFKKACGDTVHFTPYQIVSLWIRSPK
ncbi:MAG: glycoside hydrolase family 38 C-terminal domain-containing protein, partial [Chthoniobacterales bacterium]